MKKIEGRFFNKRARQRIIKLMINLTTFIILIPAIQYEGAPVLYAVYMLSLFIIIMGLDYFRGLPLNSVSNIAYRPELRKLKRYSVSLRCR